MSSQASSPNRTRCPKCGADVAAGADACGTCGLAAERFETFEREPIEAPPDVLAAWQACAAAWEDDRAHERFRAIAAARGAFAFAACAYRQAAHERGAEPTAAAGLAAVQRMAEVALLARPGTGDPPGHGPDAGRAGHRRYRRAALVMIALLLAALGLMALLMVRGARDRPDERPTAPGRGQRERQPDTPPVRTTPKN